MKAKLLPHCSDVDVAWLTLSDSRMTYWQVELVAPIYLKSNSEQDVCKPLSWLLGRLGWGHTLS